MSDTATTPSETAPAPAPALSPALSPAALATTAAIMETADRLFRTLGYQKTTVADIARELRMSPANVYRFFPSKSAICEAIADRVLDQIVASVRAVVAGPDPAPERVRKLFRLLQEQTVALFFHERRMHDMVAAALEEHWSVCDRYVEHLDEAFVQLVRDGQATGEFGGLPAEQAGSLMHSTCALFTHPTLVQQCIDKEDLPALAQGMAEFCLRALRPD
jgi:AcrR family transcriptional regulator